MKGWWDPSPAELTHLWQHEDTAAAVRSRDVGEIYRVLQRYGVSQRTIGRLTGQSQSEVSEILGGRTVRDINVLTRIAAGLCLPYAALGLAAPDAPPPAETFAQCPIPAAPVIRDRNGSVRCELCRAPVLPQPSLPEPIAPVVNLARKTSPTLAPAYWTGVESRMLRLCRRMSVREFAAHLGITDRMVSKWEEGKGNVQPRPVNQSVLDTSLKQATPEERARFGAWLESQGQPWQGRQDPRRAGGAGANFRLLSPRWMTSDPPVSRRGTDQQHGTG